MDKRRSWKVQVIVESTYGDSHPGSGHLNILEAEVRKGIEEEGGFGARYHCTDICDGESREQMVSTTALQAVR